MGISMAAYYGAAALTWALGGWRLFVLLWAWPLVANCGYVSVINWCWHAFADPQDPDNFLGAHWGNTICKELDTRTDHKEALDLFRTGPA
jgi:hypothetical protein